MNGRPFQPGKSGNPGGRPKGRVRELARNLTERTFEELERIAFCAERDQDRLKAIELILDRGYGKAPLMVEDEASGDGGRVLFGWLPAE